MTWADWADKHYVAFTIIVLATFVSIGDVARAIGSWRKS